MSAPALKTIPLEHVRTMSETVDTHIQVVRDLLDHYRASTPIMGKVEFYTLIVGKMAEAIGDDPDSSWSWRYLQSVERGTVSPSKKFMRAIDVLGAAVDGMPLDIADTAPVTVYARPGSVRPGSVIQGESIFCAYPLCSLSFVPKYANQKYHSKDCSRKHYNMRRRNQRAIDTK